MTNNTIPNVPRELLERARAAVASTNTSNWSSDLLRDIHAILSAPSPAGADGLEVVGWYRMDDRKAITPYPSVCATWHKMGVKVGAAYSDSAHAIIDGLQEKIERLQFSLEVAKTDELSAAVYAETESIKHSLWNAEKECDQHAQRIGELEGLLRAESARVDFLDAYIVTADAPDTGKVAMLADSGTLRECIDAAHRAQGVV